MHRDGRLLWQGPLRGKLEIGRFAQGVDAVGEPYSQPGDLGRVVVAELTEMQFSRRHVLLEQAGEVVRILNASGVRSIALDGLRKLAPGESCEATPPFDVRFAGVEVRVTAEDPTAPLLTLPQATLAPRSKDQIVPFPPATEVGLDRSDFECVLDVLRQAATGPEFQAAAARSAVRIAGLDAAALLLLEEGDWRVVATEPVDATATPWRPSRSMLAELLRQKRTLRRPPPRRSASLLDVQSMVAAPILDAAGEVVGALYGDRRAADVRTFQEISERDALLVEMVACGVAAGLARLAEERAALEAQIQFERFFTPQLARRLQHEPTLLEGRDADITVLFCDIRGFSRISGRLGPRGTMEWIADVMQALSECVLAHDGVLVDYMGDELMAMWGAPEPNERHAEAALRAAIDMLAVVEQRDALWRGRLGEPLRVGIGVNSGVASVGNTGSRLKFKYGPLGETVNVASRAQGAGKYLGADLIATAASVASLGEELARRPLGATRMVNIAEPIELYEIADATWNKMFRAHAAAWNAAVGGDLDLAARLFENHLSRYPDDRAAAAVARRLNSTRATGAKFDAVFSLGGK